MTTSRLRLSRAHVERLPSRTDERGPVTVQDPAEAYYQNTAAGILAQLDTPGTIWVFAAGSLIWNPRMKVAERRAAQVAGWRRAFCLSDQRYRGSPSRPGLMMALDHGAGCQGVVLRMEGGADPSGALVELLKKEPPVPPRLVMAKTGKGTVQALLFAAHPRFPLYRPEPEIGELADTLASSVGHIGTMAEYLLNTVIGLQRIGGHDAHLWRLQEMVADRLDRI